jgi:hypothetical protein
MLRRICANELQRRIREFCGMSSAALRCGSSRMAQSQSSEPCKGDRAPAGPEFEIEQPGVGEHAQDPHAFKRHEEVAVPSIGALNFPS